MTSNIFTNSLNREQLRWTRKIGHYLIIVKSLLFFVCGYFDAPYHKLISMVLYDLCQITYACTSSISIYIFKLKCSIYCYYALVESHQWLDHLPISHFSPLLPTITSLLHFHLSTTLNLNVTLHPSLPLPFLLALLIPILLL